MRFLVEYFGAHRLPADIKDAIRRIDRLADRWRRHEQQRIKMNDLFECWNQQLANENAPTIAREQVASVADGGPS